MVNRDRFWRWLSAVPALVLLVAVLPGGAAAAPLSPAQGVRIERAIQFLKDMGDKDWADNVQSWLDGAKIEADEDLGDDATTDRQATIVILAKLLAPLTDDELADPVQAFQKDSWLATLLVHEKTHAHQAPEGGAMADGPGRTPDDWDASGDVFEECKGPEATEVEAHYEMILALLRWCKVVQETPPPEGLCECELCEEEALRVKMGKIQWLLDQAKYWLVRLEELNYEKAADGESLRDKVEALEAALTGTKTEHEIKLAKIEAVEKAIEGLFGEGGAYSRARDAYKEQRGEEAAAADVGPEGAAVTFPGGWGSAFLPAVDVPGTVTLTVHRFALPPDPLPEFEYLSSVYDITVTGLGGELPAITLTFSGLSLVDCPEAKVYYFSPLKGDREPGQPAPPLWASLDTVDVSDATVKAVQAQSRYGTMHAVMAPIGSRLRKTVRMWIGSCGYTSDEVGKESDLAPFIENSRTFVAVRFLAEEFGATADWFPKDAPVEVVTLTRPDSTITIRIGSHELTVEQAGQTTCVTSDVAAQIRNGRT
ncbi:MAG: copper amine oxidase N-terminal domain-containing protein, partial [Chloroflexota bacterium]|nr:copper amine oxidase N-terminal domain-containing protein [Chloroflexota bacterium]